MAEQRKKQGRRVLITGVSSFLGLRLAKRLEQDEDVEHLVGVDLEDPPVPIKGLEFIRVDIRNPLIARVIEATKVDTVVHTNIASSPRRVGGRSQMKENNIIGTMQLLAAAQRADRIETVVMKSSAAVYGSGPGEPSVITEEQASRPVQLGGYGKDCADAETAARDFGRRRPDVDLVILRTQNVIGRTVKTSITDYLSLPVVPTALGYDPRLQLLHEEDAVAALALAMNYSGRGIYNIASSGVSYLSRAIRLLGRVELPLLLPFAQFTAGMVRRFGLVDFPLDQLKLILFGRVLDIRRAEQALGFKARFTIDECLEELRTRGDEQTIRDPKTHPSWERELFDYLRRRAEKEMV